MQKWTKDLNRHFSKEVQMVNKHMKKCSTSLVTREMQIKITMRYHFTSIRMVIIFLKMENNKGWQGCGNIGTVVYCWWECRMVQYYGKQFGSSSKSQTQNYHYELPILLPSIYLKELKAKTQTNTHTPMFIATLFTIAKSWKQPKYPSRDDWLNNVVYTYNGILFIPKNEILMHATT